MSFLESASLDIDPSTIHPLHDAVLIRIDERVEKVGSIHVPHVARDLPNAGVVVAVGRDVTECAVGDHVVIEKYAHGDREFILMGEPERRHLLVKHEQVIGVL